MELMNESIEHLSKTQKRYHLILEQLKSQIIASVRELAESCQVSENTIRRDLVELEKRGLLQRIHGSAKIIVEGTPLAFNERNTINLAAKKRMALQAMKYIPDTDEPLSVIIDAGSSCFELLKLMVTRPKVSILTPSLAVLQLHDLLARNQVILIGGLVDSKANSAYGSPAEDFLDNYSVDIAFLGITAISKNGDFYINNFNEIGFKRKILEISKHKIGLADESKWNKTGTAIIGHISQLDDVIV